MCCSGHSQIFDISKCDPHGRVGKFPKFGTPLMLTHWIISLLWLVLFRAPHCSHVDNPSSVEGVSGGFPGVLHFHPAYRLTSDTSEIILKGTLNRLKKLK